MDDAKWYVVHTYSGYENKVKANIEKTVENRNLHDQILEVIVPLETVVEIKDGSKKAAQKKMFPGYVLVKMVMNDDSWYVVRNTRGVTGFVGPGSKPVPLTPTEIKNLGISLEEEQEVKPVIQFAGKVGDKVMILSGAWEDTVGEITNINEGKQCLTINVEMFGRETPKILNVLLEKNFNHFSSSLNPDGNSCEFITFPPKKIKAERRNAFRPLYTRLSSLLYKSCGNCNNDSQQCRHAKQRKSQDYLPLHCLFNLFSLPWIFSKHKSQSYVHNSDDNAYCSYNNTQRIPVCRQTRQNF